MAKLHFDPERTAPAEQNMSGILGSDHSRRALSIDFSKQKARAVEWYLLQVKKKKIETL